VLVNSVLMVDSWVEYSAGSNVEVLSVLVYSVTVDSVDSIVEDGSVLVVSVIVVYDEGPNVVDGKLVVLRKVVLLVVVIRVTEVVGSIDAIAVGLNCCIMFCTILMIKEKVRGTGWFERDG
jgi:hypothetical protein